MNVYFSYFIGFHFGDENVRPPNLLFLNKGIWSLWLWYLRQIWPQDTRRSLKLCLSYFSFFPTASQFLSVHSPHFLPSANAIFWATDWSHHWKFFIKIPYCLTLDSVLWHFLAPTVDECGMWLNSEPVGTLTVVLIPFLGQDFKWYRRPRLALLPPFLLKEDNRWNPRGLGDTVRPKESQLLNHRWGNIILTSNACLNYQDTKKSFSKYYVFWGVFVTSAVLISVITL